MGEVLLKANITGHEYLKKIINLPVCLPEVAKSRFEIDKDEFDLLLYIKSIFSP